MSKNNIRKVLQSGSAWGKTLKAFFSFFSKLAAAAGTVSVEKFVVASVTRGRCYDFKNIFAVQNCEKWAFFNSKQS
jgi:hypothetical protein